MEDSIAARLKLYIDTQGLTNSQFADMCGIPRPSLSQLLTGRNKKVSTSMVGQIHEAFPDMSLLWLMFGEGPVKNTCESKESSETASKSSVGSVNPTNLSAYSEYGQENGVKQVSKDGKASENKVFESDLRIRDLQRQIENLRTNPRKVIQITIYYDDSTFETFVPGGSR